MSTKEKLALFEEALKAIANKPNDNYAFPNGAPFSKKHTEKSK